MQSLLSENKRYNFKIVKKVIIKNKQLVALTYIPMKLSALKTS